MSKFMFIPVFVLNDPEQVTNTLEDAKQKAQAFLQKYGGPDCRDVAVLKVEVVGQFEHMMPIWHDVELPN